MSGIIVLDSQAGGSVSLVVDDTLATDEEITLDATGNMGIESGSNANGNWTKFPDGTLMQWGNSTVTFVSNFVASDYPDFPVNFIDTNYSTSAFADRVIAETTEEILCYAAGREPTISGCRISMVVHTETTANGTESYKWQAIGRWK